MNLLRIVVGLICLISFKSAAWAEVTAGVSPRVLETQKSTVTDWITAGATLFSALAIAYAAKQVHLAREQIGLTRDLISEDHRRSRREKAVELLHQCLVEDASTACNASRVIAMSLTEQQARCLAARPPTAITINAEHEEHVKTCLGKKDDPAFVLERHGPEIVLTSEILRTVQSRLIDYLNSLEFVMVAWHHEIADRRIIEDQFRYLIDPVTAKGTLNPVLTAFGAKSYPSISAFVREMSRRDSAAPAQRPTGVLVGIKK